MQRHYGMDWLRIGAFALLIFYHIGMFFVPWDWHVKTADPSDWVAIPMRATNAWRLPLLFVVSGYASAALLDKSQGVAGFLRNRTLRLLIPTLFAIAIINPPQPWVELQFKHNYHGAFPQFWLHDYFRFGALEGIDLPAAQHLWFVVYLWVYTLFFGAILAIVPARWRARLVNWAGVGLGGACIIAVPIFLLGLRVAAVWPGAPETHSLLDDGPTHLLYFPMLLFGVLLRRSAPVWLAVQRWWKVAAILALAGYGVVALAEFVFPGNMVPPRSWLIAFALGHTVQTWCAMIALIGLADRYWNHDRPILAMLTEAVFPFYIIHQTIIVVVGWHLLKFQLPPLTEFAILLLTTTSGCWLFYRIGREIPVFRALIGLRPRARRN